MVNQSGKYSYKMTLIAINCRNLLHIKEEFFQFPEISPLFLMIKIKNVKFIQEVVQESKPLTKHYHRLETKFIGKVFQDKERLTNITLNMFYVDDFKTNIFILFYILYLLRLIFIINKNCAIKLKNSKSIKNSTPFKYIGVFFLHK